MRLTLFHRLCLAGALLGFCVVVLGAWVRLSDADLGCPDWPGCYGHLTVGKALDNVEHANQAYPHRPLEAGKAVKAAAGPVPAGLAERLVEPYVAEARKALAEGVVGDADLVDAGAIFGTGFAPFRGGPLHYASQSARG